MRIGQGFDAHKIKEGEEVVLGGVHIPSNQIKKNLSEDLNINVDQVSCKATTTDRLGYQGRKEGVSASAIILFE